MKKFIYLLLFSFALLLTMPPTESKAMAKDDPGNCFVIDQSQTAPAALVQEQETGGVAIEQAQPGDVVQAEGIKDFLHKNWGMLVLGLLTLFDMIARYTKTEKDNSISAWLYTIYDTFVPNKKKGGGTFGVSSK